MIKNISLDNDIMISQASKMHDLEMEPLYWKLEESIVHGHIDKAKNLFIIILYTAKYNKKLLKALQPGYKKRLQEISYELYSDYVPARNKSIIVKKAIIEIDLPFANESKMRDYLSIHPETLSKAFKDTLKITGTEIPCEYDNKNDYKCDIVAESEKYFYPIELKIVQANHSVVSQCSKYCWYFYRKLRYRAYKEIQGIVIANGFCDWSINELRRLNIRCFTMHLINKTIELHEIK